MARENANQAMETLEAVLSQVRLDAAFYFSVTARAPWATLTPHMRNIGQIVMPQAQRILPFHLMMEGEAWCWRKDAPEEKRLFRAGDILLLPRGCDHVIASGHSAGTAPEPDVDIYREAQESRRPCTYVDLGGEGPRATFVCGYFGAPKQSFNPLFEDLPSLLLLSPGEKKWRTIRQLVEIATEEQADRESGSRLVAARLAETMFVDAIHTHLMTVPQQDLDGWRAALRDEQIGAALRAFHQTPSSEWTLETLSKESGMSRSAFAEKFSALTGLPPIRYVQRWRLQFAANALAQTERAIKRIAEAAGYHSEPAFHRAFKQETGFTPGAWRALHRAERAKS